ncbi:MAG: hypothetical protein IPP93_08795 [Chitinophagaceae bacterium]|nr:hypothetical protein [Chitinophagaceae bacterium]
MKQENKTRREALVLIGKTGFLLGTAPYFLVSLVTTPRNAAVTEDEQDLHHEKQKLEKAVISGSGAKLTVKVYGNPGRHFFLAVAANDLLEKYRAFPGSFGTINARGTGSVIMNTETITNSRIYLKVVTGETNKFNSGMAETAAFIIITQGGIIKGFEGVVDRQIVKRSATCAATIAPPEASGKYQLH